MGKNRHFSLCRKKYSETVETVKRGALRGKWEVQKAINVSV